MKIRGRLTNDSRTTNDQHLVYPFIFRHLSLCGMDARKIKRYRFAVEDSTLRRYLRGGMCNFLIFLLAFLVWAVNNEL